MNMRADTAPTCLVYIVNKKIKNIVLYCILLSLYTIMIIVVGNFRRTTTPGLQPSDGFAIMPLFLTLMYQNLQENLPAHQHPWRI